jgi:hypothetical protein
MILWRLIAITIILIAGDTLCAQNTNQALTNVKAPASPASAIIGNQPSTIARPKSWEALETSLFSNFLDSSNRFLIPDNYALEFSPCWALNNKIEIQDFLTPSPLTSAWQNLSLSISSTNKFILNDSLKTNAIGLGLRTTFWFGTRPEIEAINTLYIDALSASILTNRINVRAGNLLVAASCDKKDFIKALIEDITTNQQAVFAGLNIPQEAQSVWILAYRQYLIDNLKEMDYSVKENRDSEANEAAEKLLEMDKTIDSLASVREERKGFKVELALAMAINYPTNRTDFSYGSKFGIWITPSFEPFRKDFKWIEYLGVLRYHWYNQDFSSRYLPDGKFYEHNIDYGLKAVLKWKTISFELEGTGRISSVVLSRTVDSESAVTKTTKTGYDRQFIATLTYQVNPTISISYNFGKTFKPVVDYQGGNLLSVATINFGLGAPRVNNLKK